jgi:hypothetical protein
MNNMLDLVGSYIIGGLVVAGIVGLILYFSSKGQETAFNEIAQRSASEVGAIIENDFKKLGYRVETGNKIISIDSSSINFRSDLNNDGVVDTVTYSRVVNNGKVNLRRRVSIGANKEWVFPVKSFTIKGHNPAGSVTYTINDVKSISFEMVLEEISINNQATAVGAAWQRQFFPKNL